MITKYINVLDCFTTYSIVLYSAVLCLAAIKYQVCPHAIMYNSIEPTPTDVAGAIVLCPGMFVCL